MAASQTYSKCGVSPRITTPRAITTSAPFSMASSAPSGSSNAPGTRQRLMSSAPALRNSFSAPAIRPDMTCSCQDEATINTLSPAPLTLNCGAPFPLTTSD